MPATWDEPTPEGHVYKTPTTYEELCDVAVDGAQAFLESWSEDEWPPDPTWRLVALAQKAVADQLMSVHRLESRIRALHHVDPAWRDGKCCVECGHVYPCKTLGALGE